MIFFFIFPKQILTFVQIVSISRCCLLKILPRVLGIKKTFCINFCAKTWVVISIVDTFMKFQIIFIEDILKKYLVILG